MTGTLAPPGPRALRALLSPGLPAAGEARALVRAAVLDWDVPVDWGIAVLAAGALVISVASRCPGQQVTLEVGFAGGRLRVEARARAGDVAGDGKPDLGLAVVALVTRDHGASRAPSGVTAYFTLAQWPPAPWRSQQVKP